MSKITIAIISFIFGMATMNDFNRHKDKFISGLKISLIKEVINN